MGNSKLVTLNGDGYVLVIPDIHGNLYDFNRSVELFREYTKYYKPLYLVYLGDLIHGPTETTDGDDRLYGYKDESIEIIRSLIELKSELGDKLILLIGNHEYSHLSGKVTSKFHSNEAEYLESKLGPSEREVFKQFFREFKLAVFAENGIVLCHGSPNILIDSLEKFSVLDFDCRNDDNLNEIIDSFIYNYGQSKEDTDKFLKNLSGLLNWELRIVLHGHDKTRKGWYMEADNQVCITCFGSPFYYRRYAFVDLSAIYKKNSDLVIDKEIRLLHKEYFDESKVLYK